MCGCPFFFEHFIDMFYKGIAYATEKSFGHQEI
jgi:hypothetical protein